MEDPDKVLNMIKTNRQSPEEIIEEYNNTSPIYKLHPKKQRLVHLFLTGKYTNKQLAEIFGVKPTTIRTWLDNEEVQAAITALQEAENKIVMQAINALRFKAIYKMNELLDADDEKVQYNAAKDILDRSGSKAEDKKHVVVEHKTFEEELFGDAVDIDDYVVYDDEENNTEKDADNGD